MCYAYSKISCNLYTNLEGESGAQNQRFPAKFEGKLAQALNILQTQAPCAFASPTVFPMQPHFLSLCSFAFHRCHGLRIDRVASSRLARSSPTTRSCTGSHRICRPSTTAM
jgi:hypothetical protein